MEVLNQKIESFNGDTSCIWTFGGTDYGTVINGSEYLHIRNGVTANETESILSFVHFGAGTYGLYLEDETNKTLYYLRYDDAQDDTKGWKTEANADPKANGNSLESYKSCVYLFKKITMQILQYFYIEPYDNERDFYEQFDVRLVQMKKLLEIA